MNSLRPANWKNHATVLALCFALSLAAAAQTKYVRQEPNGRLEPDTSSVKMSPQDQIKVGRQAAAQVAKQLPLLPDSSPISQYVAQIGRGLASHAPGYKWPFEFHVVNQKEINAFALPGGPVFVNLGTIQAADNEAQLAGVMAHEIGHVVMMHSARQAAETRPYQIAGALGSAILGGIFGGFAIGQLGQLGIQLGAGGVIMKYSRTAETEADLMGSQIMYDSGYDPHAMVAFFDKLKQQGGSGTPQFLSDHPDPGNRAETIQKVISRFPQKQYVMDSPTYQQVHQEALHTRAYTAQEIAQRQRSGGDGARLNEVSASDVLPARGMRQLKQPGFSISYPSNWQLYGTKGGGSLVIAPPAGVHRTAISYGMSIGSARGNQGQNLDEITREILNALQRNNPEMQATGSPQPIQAGGVDGRSVELRGISPLETKDGKRVPERDRLVVLPRQDGSVLFMIYTAPERDFAKLQPTFEAMLGSVKLR